MSTGVHEPADTRSMGIVHSALRRDLERTRMVASASPHPDEKRRRAVASHMLWMMHFLHVHHTGEDVGLWPLVRSKNPAAGDLLDRMDEDHRRIAPAITAMEAAARAYREDPAARERFLEALTELRAVLLPHLEREEREMMPVVATTLTDEEYHAVEQEHFVKPKGFMELGAEGHWIIDGLTSEDREVMLGVVPAVPRFVLLHGFAPAYRRRKAVLWGSSPAAALPSLDLARMEERA
jgi:hypothetical protein